MTDETEISAPAVTGAPVPERGLVFIFVVAVFVTCLICGAILAIKPIAILFPGWTVLVPVGTFAFALTFAATDVISEVWGRKAALQTIGVGLAIRFLLLAMFLVGMNVEDRMPFVAQADIWSSDNEAAFEFVLAGANRANIAGMVAFLISAVTDVLIYHYFRERDRGKNRLWVRNNVSTIFAQIVNSIVFIAVAFGGDVALTSLLSLVTGQIMFKAATAIVDTPMVYILRNLAMRRPLFDFSG